MKPCVARSRRRSLLQGDVRSAILGTPDNRARRVAARAATSRRKELTRGTHRTLRGTGHARGTLHCDQRHGDAAPPSRRPGLTTRQKRSLDTALARARTIAPSGARKTRHFSRTFDGITLAAAMFDTVDGGAPRTLAPASSLPSDVPPPRATDEPDARDPLLSRALPDDVTLPSFPARATRFRGDTFLPRIFLLLVINIIIQIKEMYIGSKKLIKLKQNCHATLADIRATIKCNTYK